MANISTGKSNFTNLTANSIRPEYTTHNIIPAQGKVEVVDFDLLTEELKEEADLEIWWENQAEPFIENVSKKTGKALEKTGATISTGIVSFFEGVGQFGEAAVDLIALAGTGLASVGTGIYDGYQAINGKITGEQWESLTKKMWEDTKEFVATERVKSKFDEFYENNEKGQWMKENSLWFDSVRGVGSGIGYVAGVIGISCLTFGVGGAAIGGTGAAAGTVTAGQLATTAGLAGFSRGTERAWVNGADIVEGLEYGAWSGIWEGLQFYVGAKISAPGGFGDQIASKFMNNSLLAGSLARVTLDGATGGAEGFMQPLLDLVYKDSYKDANGKEVKFDENMTFKEKYKEAFDDAGGWKNVGIQTAIGTGMSSFGEFGNLRNILAPEGNKNIDTNVKVETDNSVNYKKISKDQKTANNNMTTPKNQAIIDEIPKFQYGDIEKRKLNIAGQEVDEALTKKYGRAKSIYDITTGDYDFNRIRYGKDIADKIEKYNSAAEAYRIVLKKEDLDVAGRAVNEALSKKYGREINIGDITTGDYDFNYRRYGKDIADKIAKYNEALATNQNIKIPSLSDASLAVTEALQKIYSDGRTINDITIGNYDFNKMRYGKDVADKIEIYNKAKDEYFKIASADEKIEYKKDIDSIPKDLIDEFNEKIKKYQELNKNPVIDQSGEYDKIWEQEFYQAKHDIYKLDLTFEQKNKLMPIEEQIKNNMLFLTDAEQKMFDEKMRFGKPLGFDTVSGYFFKQKMFGGKNGWDDIYEIISKYDDATYEKTIKLIDMFRSGAEIPQVKLNKLRIEALTNALDNIKDPILAQNLKNRLTTSILDSKFNERTEFYILSKALKEKCDNNVDNSYTRLYDSIIASYKKGNTKDALFNLEALAKLNNDIDFILVKRGAYIKPSYNNSKYQYALNKHVKSSSTNYHEFGHIIYHMLYDAKLPSNIDRIIMESQENAKRNVEKLIKFSEEFNQEYHMLSQQGEEMFNKQIIKEFGTIEKYKSTLSKELKRNMKNGEIEKYLDNRKLSNKTLDEVKNYIKTINEQQPEKTILNDLFISKDIKDITDRIIESEKNYVIEQTTRKGYNGAVSDIISAIYKKGSNITVNDKKIEITFCHDDDYWNRNNNYEETYDEIVANINSLKMKGKTEKIKELREIFGNELFDTIDDMFDKIQNN